jgi:hypothetical protein
MCAVLYSFYGAAHTAMLACYMAFLLITLSSTLRAHYKQVFIEHVHGENNTPVLQAVLFLHAQAAQPSDHW